MIEIDLKHSVKRIPLKQNNSFGRLLMDIIGACTGEERIKMKKLFPEEVEAWGEVSQSFNA